MAKKSAKATKKIKKVNPAKTVSKNKKKAVKPLKKTAAKKKAVKEEKLKAKKAAKPTPVKSKKPAVEKTLAKKEKVNKIPEKKAPVLTAVKPRNEPTAVEQIDPVEVKKKKTPVPKPKKIKKVFIPFNPIQPVTTSGKPVNTTKKEPKGKFELEYVIRCSEPLLYEFTTTPSGLSEWFADNVNVRDGIYTFIWNGSEQKARLLALKEDSFVRYQWVDRNDGSYFEFRIQTDELTGDISLIIIDFAEDEEEKQSAKLLWDAQVDKLMKTIGSH